MTTDFEISNYEATDKQLLAKIKIHQYVSPQVLGTLTLNNLARIRHYLYPISVEEVVDWATENEAFWYWFTIPNCQAMKMDRMKSKAIGVVDQILSGEVPDSKLAGVQLKAAQMLLNMSDKPQNNITKNSLHMNARPEIPKELAKKSTADLQNEILRLQKEHNIETTIETQEEPPCMDYS